jgi:hypothetical protein
LPSYFITKGKKERRIISMSIACLNQFGSNWPPSARLMMNKLNEFSMIFSLCLSQERKREVAFSFVAINCWLAAMLGIYIHAVSDNE